MWKKEKEIVITLQEVGFGLTKDIGVVINDYLNDQLGHPNPFIGGVPGEVGGNISLSVGFRTECLKATASTNSLCSFSHSQSDGWM